MAEEKNWTTLELIKWTTDYFKSKGMESPRVDAEILLAWVLDCKRMDLYMRWDDPVLPEHRDTFRELVIKRAQGKPVQYLTGEQEFHDLRVQVDERVLIPRQETEWLVDYIFSLVKSGEILQPKTVLEIGTGSGAMALSFAKQWPSADVWATDISRDALDVARVNAETAQISNIRFLEGDLLQPIIEKIDFFDLVVANLPYISSEQINSLPKEVREHEPRLALDGGVDGFTLISRTLQDVAVVMKSGASLFLEMDLYTAPLAEKTLFETNEWTTAKTLNDLSGKARVVFAVKR